MDHQPHTTDREGRNAESGVALVTVLLLMMLAFALLSGFSAVVMNDEGQRSVDKNRTVAFYAAHGALEQLTSSVGLLFTTNYAPKAADFAALTATLPTIPGVTFVAEDGTPGYKVAAQNVDADGNPVTEVRSINTGMFEGFTGLVTPYRLSVVARTRDTAIRGSEVALERQMNTVAIPVFQFGIFSDIDLAFHAGSNFNFGGRVHTNGNMFPSADGGTLTFSGKVTAVGEIYRDRMINGISTSPQYTNPVNVVLPGGGFRNLELTEGSNVSGWTDLSMTTYGGNIRNGATGVRRLELPFVSAGATPIDLIKRGVSGEAPAILTQRYYTMASLRILLSDSAAEITGLPGIDNSAPPRHLDGAGSLPGYGLQPLAAAGAGEPYLTDAGSPLLNGFIKIEVQHTDDTWHDVTPEILALGITGGNPLGGCATPNPDAVLRLQRVRNVPSVACGATATDFWPNVLYDAREGSYRNGSGGLRLGGIMHYVELDANNLRKWFVGTTGASGPTAKHTTGYVVYFSDRRGNKDLANNETGEFGVEDFVNPGGEFPNSTLEAGEDVNGNGTQQLYGKTPRLPMPAMPLNPVSPMDVNANVVRDLTTYAGVAADRAQANRTLFFRRAVKLTNGAPANIIDGGLTVVAENPVYVQGNWNADGGGFGGPHKATAVMADAVTLLSNNWNDVDSFSNTGNVGARPHALTTYYRLAVLSGKGKAFPNTGGTPDFGSDGGVHNFLRLLEDWGGATLNFKGSIASFYYSRQATGTYKCCTNVYGVPSTRDFTFDLDFLEPAKLPPLTPMFRDINGTEFTERIQ